jgi:uncharacterized protein (TIGR02677 family)
MIPMLILCFDFERYVEAARRRLATGQPTRLSDLGELDRHAFGLFLGLLGEALTEQAQPEAAVSRQTGDGLLHISLTPLAAESWAEIYTSHGVFAGRDHAALGRLLVLRCVNKRWAGFELTNDPTPCGR